MENFNSEGKGRSNYQINNTPLQFSSFFLYLGLMLGLISVLIITGINLSQVSKFGVKKNQKLIVSTTSLINDLVKTIGGEHVKAIYLINEWEEPEHYKASSLDREKLLQADMVFYHGLYFEVKMMDLLLALSKKKPTYPVSELIDESKLILLSPGKYDPHIWFDLSLWREAALLVRNRLIEILPKAENEIHQNYSQMVKRMDGIDKIIIDRVTKISNEKRLLISIRNDFSYFAKRYGFRTEYLKEKSTLTVAPVELTIEEFKKSGRDVDNRYLQMMVYNVRTIINGLGTDTDILTDQLLTNQLFLNNSSVDFEPNLP